MIGFIKKLFACADWVLQKDKAADEAYKWLKQHQFDCLDVHKAVEALSKEGLGKHKVHDTRHTTITLLTEAQVDERFIAKIVGHSQKSLAQKVYSHITNETLLAEINKI